jgi:O-antigen ligase
VANRIALTLVFTLSFGTYLMPELTVSVQIAPLALFAALVLVKVFFSPNLASSLESLFTAESLAFVFLLSLLIIAPAIQSEHSGSLAFSLMLALCLVLARLYMSLVPIQEVLEAFFWSGVVSVSVFLALAFTSLMEAIQTVSRFSVFSFHPNLLAFVLAGYFCVMIWKFVTAKWILKVISALVGVLCLVVIFFASSRGSILAIMGGCGAAVLLTVCRQPRERRRKSVRLFVVSAVLLCAVAVYVPQLETVNNALEFTDQILQVTHPQRGIESGFTGRFDKWELTLNALSDGSWIIGHGIRSSDSQEQLIDNSYLVMLYEIGIVPLILVCFRYVTVLGHFLRSYLKSRNEKRRLLHFSCTLLILVFVTNNIVARFLLSVGNPFSLMALLLFVTPTSMIVAKAAHPHPHFYGDSLAAR